MTSRGEKNGLGSPEEDNDYARDSLMEIRIESKVSSTADLEFALGSALPPDVRIVRRGMPGCRGPDVTVLVALVGAGGAVIGALVTGLLRVLEQARAKSIVIVGRTGRRIEIPASVPAPELDRLIDAARELDIEKITLL